MPNDVCKLYESTLSVLYERYPCANIATYSQIAFRSQHFYSSGSYKFDCLGQRQHCNASPSPRVCSTKTHHLQSYQIPGCLSARSLNLVSYCTHPLFQNSHCQVQFVLFDLLENVLRAIKLHTKSLNNTLSC